MAFATLDAFKADPSRVWQWYSHRRNRCLEASPNAAHRSLTHFLHPTSLATLSPTQHATGSLPLLITQNIDALSTRVLDDPSLPFTLTVDEKTAAKERIFEMHGNIFVTQCTDCKATKHSYDKALCKALDDPEKYATRQYDDLKIEQLPRCGGDEWNGSNRYGRCGGLLRPDVVWFGEIPKLMGDIARILNWCDMLIIVGTSSIVHPAAGFAKTVQSHDGKVAVFALEPSEQHAEADFAFFGPCEETLPKVLGV